MKEKTNLPIIVFGEQKEKGNYHRNYYKIKNLIVLKSNMQPSKELEVLIHELIHYFSDRYRGIIGDISEDRTMKLGKRFVKILKKEKALEKARI